MAPVRHCLEYLADNGFVGDAGLGGEDLTHQLLNGVVL